ncbi:MAG TPA: molybdopterin-dependent oxidoreductase [Bacillota bacterium]|nr:molybdopterin-dependent oxidoreductase [Bacillota bacterium]
MKTYRSACPLNCWDQCSFIVKVKDNTVVSIEPDPAQKITGRFICAKGRKHISRLRRPDRLTFPLIKTASGFQQTSWPEALALAAAKIKEALSRYGPLSLLHYYDSGHGGLLKNIESRFFSALGGCTVHKGSLCWSAGLAAQTYDFGAVLSHALDDLSNSRLIIVWGRNPAATARHQLPFILKARQKGARLIVIDPLYTATAALADEHISPRPASDGALALGMAHLIIKEKLVDEVFIRERSSGFAAFRQMVEDYPPEKVSAITGLPAGHIIRLARLYATARPAAILLGYGLQRHSNGGNTIRAIDALAALTGNIGVPGGGVSYANLQVAPYIDSDYLEGEDLKPQRRYYPKPRLAAALQHQLKEPPVQVAYISRANPLVQVGDSAALKRAFAAIPFKIVSDQFMTDTAAAADLVLPCTAFLEEEDLYYNSMSHCYLNYGPKIVDPPGQCRHEYEIMQALARELGATGFPQLPAEELLAKLILPLTREKGITLQQLKAGPLWLPGAKSIPWRHGPFATADGKFNFYASAAENEGSTALPHYQAPRELGNSRLHRQGFRYWFVTPHPADSIHSAHRLPGESKKPQVYLSPQLAEEHGLAQGDRARVSSPRGFLEAEVSVSPKIPPATVMVYEGWWEHSGAAVNNLTSGELTDMGNQAALYDCLCKIEKV